MQEPTSTAPVAVNFHLHEPSNDRCCFRLAIGEQLARSREPAFVTKDARLDRLVDHHASDLYGVQAQGLGARGGLYPWRR